MLKNIALFVVLLSICIGPEVLYMLMKGPTARPEIAIDDPATFASWPSITEKPIGVTLQLSGLCTYTGSTTINSGDLKLDDSPSSNPHLQHSIVVRVSPEAASAYRAGEKLPTGAVVIKEKYDNRTASGPLNSYAAMLKREPGYDPPNGDWEYAFVTLLPGRRVNRGKLSNCANCHAAAKDTDFLFRTDGKTVQ